MKTITKDGQVKRVADKEASSYIKEGWQYCPKSVLKTQKRK